MDRRGVPARSANRPEVFGLADLLDALFRTIGAVHTRREFGEGYDLPALEFALDGEWPGS